MNNIPKPASTLSLPRSSSIFLSKADWGIVRKCMLQYAKMPLTFTVSNEGSYFWPTLSSACKPKIVSTIYYMSGSNWNLIRNGMNYIWQALCRTKRHWWTNWKIHSAGIHYESCQQYWHASLINMRVISGTAFQPLKARNNKRTKTR